MNKKRIVLCLTAFLTVLAMLICCVGCESEEDSGTRKKSSKTSQIETSDETKSDTSSEKEELFTRKKVSGLKAEKIDYYYSADMPYTCFVNCIDGRYGTMDDKGIMIADPIFEKPYFTICYYAESLTSGDSQFKCVLWCNNGNNGEDIIVFSEDGGLLECKLIPFGIEDSATVYWLNGKPVMILGGGSTGIVECTREEYYKYGTNVYNSAAYMNHPGAGQSRIIPIQEISDLAKDDSTGDTYYSPVLKSEKYGLFDFDKNKMLTDFIYDECKGPIDGVFAVRKGDKWGYVTEEGKKLTGLVYDVANVHVSEYDPSYKNNEMYLPVNGYIVTVKDGKYGMIDKGGKTVLENKYGYISQVSGSGVFFVLDDGEWNRCVMK